MPRRGRRVLGLPMKNSVVMASVALGRETGGHKQQSDNEPVNRGTRLRHKELSDLQPNSILGQAEDN